MPPSRAGARRQRTSARSAATVAVNAPDTGAPPANEALKRYSAKRAFDVSPEPGPIPVSGRTGPLLFVVQQHAARRMHWDFRLELDGVLKSWAVPKAPSLNPADKRLAVHVEDHPFNYASFEGVIPEKQYGAGEVIVWDCGVYSPDEQGQYWFHDREQAQRELREGYQRGKLSIFLRGEKLKGSFALVRTSDPKNWFLIKHRDRFVRDIEVAQLTRSIVSGMTLQQIERLPAHERVDALQLAPSGPRESMPAKLLPMMAELGDEPFSNDKWLHEPKLDGYRALAFIRNGKVELRSRRGLDLTPCFPVIAAELAQQAVDAMLLDGEIVAFDTQGKPSFNALQNRAQLKSAREIGAAEQASPCVFYAFDLLHFAGLNLRGAPYQARRRYLAQCLLPAAHLQVMHADENGVALYEAALANGFEGTVAKRKDSRYEPGRRSPSWLKSKATKTVELVIGGYTKGKGAREPLGALLLGYWDRHKLVYAGNAGTGFDENTLRDVKARCDALRTSKRPFAEKPPVPSIAAWVKPELAAEVKYAAWTPDLRLRAPVFLRLRDDVDPSTLHGPLKPAEAAKAKPVSAQDAQLEEVLSQLETNKANIELMVGSDVIKITNLDRVYWPADPSIAQPAITKRDLLRYFTCISELILPHLADRPLTMIRMPEGIHGERFYQKHWEHTLPPFVANVNIYSESKDERQDYLLCNNLPTLLWLAQVGTLEFHVWHSRVKPGPDALTQSTDFSSSLQALESSVLNYPDYLVFDIDPYIYSGKEAPGAEPELNDIAFEKGKQVAFWLRELLLGMGLEPIVKTSGKTGLHVFVAIERTLTFDAARQMCEVIGRHLMAQHPKDITMDWAVKKRTGKIFMDYNMNVRAKTLNVAYSPRGVAGAPISMPLTWDELEHAHPLGYRLNNVVRRLQRDGDVWKDALRRKHSLEKVLGSTKQ
jgi:bifunctional non-homologous end joining protein LigD